MVYSMQGGQFSMIVLVPTGNTTINALLERISKMPIEKIYHHMITEEEEYPDAAVEVYLPRVVINSDLVLNKALEKVRNVDVVTHILFLNTVQPVYFGHFWLHSKLPNLYRWSTYRNHVAL
jgi:hypothetical protein